MEYQFRWLRRRVPSCGHYEKVLQVRHQKGNDKYGSSSTERWLAWLPWQDVPIEEEDAKAQDIPQV